MDSLIQEQDRQELEALREDLELVNSCIKRAQTLGRSKGSFFYKMRIRQINAEIEFIESRNKGDVK